MWSLPFALMPLRGTEWRTSGLCVNTYSLATLQQCRDRLASSPLSPSDMKKYLDYLLALVHVLEMDRDRAVTQTQVYFNWEEDGKSYRLTSLRGEIVLVAVLWMRHLLTQNDPSDWQLMVRLARWVALPNLNAWMRRDLLHLPTSCSPNHIRYLMTAGLVRLQVETLRQWELNPQPVQMGERLGKWAAFFARQLRHAFPEVVALADELDALLWMFHAMTMQKEQDKMKQPKKHAALSEAQRRDLTERQHFIHRLNATSLARFEMLGHRDRVDALRAIIPLGYQSMTTNEAHDAVAKVKPLAAYAEGGALQRVYKSRKEDRDEICKS